MVRYVYCTASTLDGFLADDADGLEWLLTVPGAEGAGAFATFSFFSDPSRKLMMEKITTSRKTPHAMAAP